MFFWLIAEESAVLPGGCRPITTNTNLLGFTGKLKSFRGVVKTVFQRDSAS